jgi:hypothetical protein
MSVGDKSRLHEVVQSFAAGNGFHITPFPEPGDSSLFQSLDPDLLAFKTRKDPNYRSYASSSSRVLKSSN